MDTRLHIAHVLYRLDYGGMENGIVNLVNRMPRDDFRHSILALTHATSFQDRIDNDDVDIIEFDKPEGNHFPTFRRIRRALKELQPDIVHTRNLGTLDISVVSRLAGCKIHVHGEHGWHAEDLQGGSRKHRFIRKACDPFIRRYVAVSHDIARWMTDSIGIDANKIETIHNGVDVARFGSGKRAVAGASPGGILFGTIGRQDPIKGLGIFIEAVAEVLRRRPELRDVVRVVMAGDGPERDHCKAKRDELGLADIISLPGTVDDVPALLDEFDFFVQPSLNEGISNTVLEAMASGVAVVATAVGGNPELVRDGIDGCLVTGGDVSSLVDAISRYARDASLHEAHGASARERAIEAFSLDAMTQNYADFYRRLAA